MLNLIVKLNLIFATSIWKISMYATYSLCQNIILMSSLLWVCVWGGGGLFSWLHIQDMKYLTEQSCYLTRENEKSSCTKLLPNEREIWLMRPLGTSDATVRGSILRELELVKPTGGARDWREFLTWHGDHTFHSLPYLAMRNFKMLIDIFVKCTKKNLFQSKIN